MNEWMRSFVSVEGKHLLNWTRRFIHSKELPLRWPRSIDGVMMMMMTMKKKNDRNQTFYLWWKFILCCWSCLNEKHCRLYRRVRLGEVDRQTERERRRRRRNFLLVVQIENECLSDLSFLLLCLHSCSKSNERTKENEKRHAHLSLHMLHMLIDLCYQLIQSKTIFISFIFFFDWICSRVIHNWIQNGNLVFFSFNSTLIIDCVG